MRQADLAGLKEMFRDNRTWVGMGRVIGVRGITSKRSAWRVKLSMFPEGQEVIARRGWFDSSAGSGVFAPPRNGMLAVVVFPNGDSESGVIVSFLSSDSDPIPASVAAGDTLVKAAHGLKTRIESTEKIFLAKFDSDPAQNLVLGQVLKSALSSMLGELKSLCDALAAHTHVGNLGVPTSAPNNAGTINARGSAFNDLKASPVDNENMLSDLSFTEK